MTVMTQSAPPHVAPLFDQACAARDRGDFRGCLAAADALLATDGRNLGGLILKGDALAGLGDVRAASSFYARALELAARNPPPSNLVAELRRIHRVQQDNAGRFETLLRQGVAAKGFDPAVSSQRFARSLDLLTGRKPHYQQEPKFYLFPGLADIEFRSRRDTPWLDEVEAALPTIREELRALMMQPDIFAPYVEDRSNRPRTAQGGMLENAAWSAVFLWKDGVEVPEIAARCPQTLKALANVPLSRIPGRSPSILFSRLTPGARIPPHHGLINTRLICHLPLIAPPGSWFRVGGDMRQWEEGKAWAFDDTIEHEARNDSGQDRTILIFDVWKPELTQEERDLVCALFEAIDEAGGSAPKLGS